MARHPRDASEAVEQLGVSSGDTVVAVGPDHGYAQALTDMVGSEGRVIVQSPPPDEDQPKGVEVVDAVPDDVRAAVVLGWTTVLPVHAVRALGSHVADDGSLVVVMPKVDRETRAAVTEGELKRAMLAAGWREERVMPLAGDAFAIRFRKRR